jgi:uncharacterized iron-regulated membrane protein
MTHWQRWVSHPQSVWLRKAMFQLHLWSGIGIGLYVLIVSVTGSIAVYRNELYVAATPAPIVLAQSGPRLTDDALKAAATHAYPGYAVVGIDGGQKPGQPVRISLSGRAGHKDRLFNQYTGADLGDSVPLGIWLVSKLLELHDDLLLGTTGRSINGFGALLWIVLAFTGIVVWWPGIKTWRRSLIVHGNLRWRRFAWELHGMIGLWTLGAILMFALSGAYLGNPQPIQDLADRLYPPTAADAGDRIIDRVIYWLAYLHFGRVNGIGIPCHGPGLCDQATKAVWAVAGLAPAVLFVTGSVMWWNRVVRKRINLQ